MSSTRIESLVDEVQRAFDEPPEQIEAGLDVDDAALLQLRKACRLLAGSGWCFNRKVVILNPVYQLLNGRYVS